MKVEELASRLGLELRGDGGAEVLMPAPVEMAGPGTITFLGNPKYAAKLQSAMPACVIVSPGLAERVSCPALISANPYLDFARTLALFFPPYRPPVGIDPSARIAADARIGEGASIGALCVIGSGVGIGPRAIIHPSVTIYPDVSIGEDLVCHSQVSIRERVTVGNRVTIHNGAVIGADGFGFIEHGGDLVKVPQVGSVVIEDDVEIGANCTIDRATLGATVLHRGVKLDNLVHIAHNCEIGEFSRFAAQVGVAGSTRVGQWCELGGQVGLAGHLSLGDHVRCAAQSGVPNDIASGKTVGGTPSVEIRTWRRMVAAWPRLPDVLRRLRALEKGSANGGEAQERE